MKYLLTLAFCLYAAIAISGTDGDGVPDESDNCPNVANADQLDTDADGLGDGCDADDDNDEVLDADDAFPLDAKYTTDSDLDGLPDGWEIPLGLDINDAGDAASDFDGDGLTALQEFGFGTSPTLRDSDRDTLPDGWEVENDSDPLVPKYLLQASSDGYFTCAVDDSGLQCWGLMESYTPELTAVIDIAAGTGHACALSSANVVSCWGFKNDEGQQDVPTLTKPTQIVAGDEHTCALDSGQVICWGSNYSGETEVPTLSNPSFVSAGARNTCAIDDDGFLCWGQGFGDAAVSAAQIPHSLDIGGYGIGNSHVCAVYDENVSNYSTASSSLFAASVVENLVCYGYNAQDQINVPALDGTKAVQIALGRSHSCALLATGTVKCWGSNSYAQLDVPEGLETSQIAVISSGNSSVCTLSGSGVDCWGWNSNGQSSVPELLFDPDQDGYNNQNGVDAFPLDPSEWLDSDNDGTGNNADTDDDGDEVADEADAFPLISLGGLADSDGDGIPNDCDSSCVASGMSADADDDNDEVPDDTDLYPLDASRSTNTPYYFAFEGIINIVTDSEENKEPHQIRSGEKYRYVIVVDNNLSAIASQSWSRSNIEFLSLTFNNNEDASVLVDVNNMRAPPGIFPSGLSGDLTLETDANGALSKTWNDAIFLGLSGDISLDWYQTFGWLDGEIGVAARLQARTDTVAEGAGLYSPQSSFGFTGVDHNTRIEAPSEWDSAQPAECLGPLLLDSQQDVDWILSHFCVRVLGDLVIQTAEQLDLTPLRIIRTIDGALSIDLPNSASLDGLQGVSHIDGLAVPDEDGDYHPDFMDQYPDDPAAAFDSDGDGLPNDWLPGYFASSVDPDLTLDSDDDGDGVLDWEDMFPLDPVETIDTDSDGIGDNTDTDDDNDGMPDDADNCPNASNVDQLDTDADGQGNECDGDDDDDGVPDADDSFPLDATESVDTDADGTGNNADTDDDNDEVPDADDAFPLDADESVDTDTDGTGNNADTDDDNDGALDADDAFPLDAAESVDTDLDGTGNNADTDDDNDGALDEIGR